MSVDKLYSEYVKFGTETEWDTYHQVVKEKTESLMTEYPEQKDKLLVILDYIEHPDIDDIGYSQTVILGLLRS